MHMVHFCDLLFQLMKHGTNTLYFCIVYFSIGDLAHYFRKEYVCVHVSVCIHSVCVFIREALFSQEVVVKL